MLNDSKFFALHPEVSIPINRPTILATNLDLLVNDPLKVCIELTSAKDGIILHYAFHTRKYDCMKIFIIDEVRM